MITKKNIIISYLLLFFQILNILFFSLIPAVKAIENADVAEKMVGTQSFLEQDEINNYPFNQNLFRKKANLINSYEYNNKITKSLPNLGSIKTLPEENHEAKLASYVSQIGNILSNNNSTDVAINYAKSIGEGLVNQKVNDWLAQYGSSRISIGSDRNISGDFLLPVIDDINSLLFIQLGSRINKDKNTLNLGLGYRKYCIDRMYGINAFYDYDYSGGNARLGLGGESWTDYLKLAANGYFGLTNWHQSKIVVMDDYDERPATGFDVRAEAYLPTYPKLGASIKYEQYFGKGLHLGTGVEPDKLKDDPYTLTLGINYTPIPLITLKGEHAAGDRNNTMIGMDIIYRFGVPLSKQLDPDAVMRSLVGNKYDFVDRNYDIVKQYRKQELINISLPAEMRAEEKETIIIPATVNKTKYGLKKINWIVSPSFIANGGSYQVISATQLEIILPAYVYKTNTNIQQEYQISAIGIDNNNNKSNKATTIIRVKPSRNVVNDLIVKPNTTLPANNKDRFTTTAVITNEYGQPLSHQVITFRVDGLKQPDGKSGATLSNGYQSVTSGDSITATTDNQGKAVIYITSKVAGEGKIAATMENGNYKNVPLKFSADRNSAQIAKLNVIKDKALADGKEKNMLYALVADQNGNVVEDIAVNLTATNGAVIENVTTANTNQHGKLIFGVTSTRAGNSEVTAEINGSQKKQSVAFVTGHPSVEKSLLAVQPEKIIANGTSSAKLTLTLKDTNGHAISGQKDKVKFLSSLENSVVGPIEEESVGTYSATLTGTKAGGSRITVKFNGELFDVNPATVTLTADTNNPDKQKSTLVANPTTIVANGQDISTLKLTLKDTNGNIITGRKIIFRPEQEEGIILSKVIDNQDGTYTTTVRGTKGGQKKINVIIDDKDFSKDIIVTFITYDFSINAAEKNILVNGTFRYLITAKPSNGEEAITITSDIDWSSDNKNIATIDNNGLVTGKEIGQSTIQATGVYKDLKFKKESLLSVKNKKISEIYGEIRENPKEYLITPPSYSLCFGGGHLVDAIGTEEDHTGGHGGEHVTISDLHSVRSIIVTIGTDYGCNFIGQCLGYGQMIAKLQIIFKNGNRKTVGQAKNFQVTEDKTFIVEDGYILQGIRSSSISLTDGSKAVRSISFISMPNLD